MTGSRGYACALAATLLAVCAAMPLSQPESETDQVLPQRTQVQVHLWDRRDALKEATERVARRQKALKTRVARQEQIGALTDDQRDFMSKQIVQAISEMISKEGCFGYHPLSDRDYQGWMDFGRRSTGEQGLD
ncbi:gastrin/cholecystokinin-like peptide [Megalops cyprinoides]|uniref:gastrin/cholecystokinin-like peptide n=1 Tax=Megalops cyprinoides TaxID=118141 RepID=UPI001863F0A8|nr:gastrin/cholecystokinin-like peptide [Megalops cyprinoides]